MLLFHTDNLPYHGLERVFEFAKKAGYDGIEVGINGNYDTHNSEYLKTLEKRFKIPIKAFSMDIKQEEKWIKAYQETVRDFKDVTMNLHAGSSLSFKYQKWLTEIAPKIAKKYNLTLCRRNLPFESFLGFLPKRKNNTLRALKAQGNVCVDMTALALSNEDIMRAIESLGAHLKHTYLSNVYRHMPYSLPNKGVLPVESFLTKLAKIGYRGNFTMYVAGSEFNEGNDDLTIKRMIEARKFFEKYFVDELEKD